MTLESTLPTRGERLRTFIALKIETLYLRAAVALLAAIAVILAIIALQRPTAPEAVPIGRGIAGVAPRLDAAPAPPPGLSGERDIGSGSASYYGEEFNGSRTASGERFDPRRLTAAHRTLPLGSRVRVTHAASGESIVVRINDRGPFHGNRAIDLSQAAAERLGMLGAGTARVRLAVLRA